MSDIYSKRVGRMNRTSQNILICMIKNYIYLDEYVGPIVNKTQRS